MHVWTVLGTWTWVPVPGTGIIAAAAAYLAAAAVVGRRNPGRPWPARHTACFLSGLLLTWIVILGPVGAYDDVFFWAHMVQHIALMMIIAPLLVLGSPVLLVLRVASPAVRRRWIVPVLRSRALHALTHPVFTWVLFAGVLIGTHFSPFYNFALTHPAVHEYLEHPLYLGAALLFYYPLLDGNPGPRPSRPGMRVLSLGLMMMPESLTGFFIYAAKYVMYPYYLTVQRPFAPGPLADQRIGGILMWAGGMLIDTGWVVLAVAAWLRADQARTRRVDAQLAREAAQLRNAPSPGSTPGKDARVTPVRSG